jgi:hypothetical protein
LVWQQHGIEVDKRGSNQYKGKENQRYSEVAKTEMKSDKTRTKRSKQFNKRVASTDGRLAVVALAFQ